MRSSSSPANQPKVVRIQLDDFASPINAQEHQRLVHRRSSSQSSPNSSLSSPDEHSQSGSRNEYPEQDSDHEYSDDGMASRPPMHRPTDGRSQVPLLKDENRGRRSSLNRIESRDISTSTRRSNFRSRTPEYDTKHATRRKYIIASFFLVLSLVSFTVQTQTAVYIQQELGWDKPYCMLYMTHGSWVFLWPTQLLLLRIQKRRLTWAAFWRRHLELIRTTAQMVETQHLHPKSSKSPVLYIVRTVSVVTTALTVAGGSWYVAVNLTTGSDLTAIYNCSAFFAYAFSIPLLNDKLRLDKVFSVLVAIAGVVIVAYGGASSPDGVPPSEAETKKASNRAVGNIVIGVGSVLYGLYEVLYKKLACPPEGTSAGRGVIFANTFASLIGLFTILVLWIPLPVLHVTGIETFEWPQGEAAWLLIISTLSNAIFSGSFLVLISLTSPVLSSVAALLTIFIVALVDWKFNHKELGGSSITGGILIIIAFLLLSWSTYREMDEERKKRLADNGSESDSEE